MKLKILFIIALMYCGMQAAIAQQKTDTTKLKTISLDEITISANKFAETKKTVAQDVNVVNKKEIEGTQAQSTADVISRLGGVHVQKSQLGGGSPNIRGFEGNRVLLVIDGIRMNNLIYRGGHMQDLIKTDNNNLDRIEVLYGPSSTIYGSDALGGVILMYTMSPLFSSDGKLNFKANAMTRYGSVDNESTSHVDLNFGCKKFASLTSFTYAKFGDLKGGANQNPFYSSAYGERPYYAERIDGKDSVVMNSNRFLQKQSGYSQYDILQKFAYKQNDHITHGLNFQYSNSSNVPRYDRLTLDGSRSVVSKDSTLGSAEWYYGPQSRLLAAYDFNYDDANGKLNGIHFGLNYQALEESRHNRNFGNNWLKNRIENVNVIGANIDMQKTIKNHELRFGADMQLNSLKSTANKRDIVADTTAKFATRFPDGKNHMNNFAAYISHTWKISKMLTLVDGLRVGYSSLHSTLADPTNPPDPLPASPPFTDINQKTIVYSGSLGIISTPTDDLKLSFLVSTGFRVPNVDDVTKIFDPAPGTVRVPNVNLKPEKTVNYELGVTKIFNGNTRWENYVYYTDLYDAIVVGESTFDGKDSILYDGSMSKVYSNQNKGRAYIFGFSTNVRSQLSQHFTMAFGLNYNYGRIKTDSVDTPMDHIPPFMANLLLNYTYKKFSSEFFINYNGWKRAKDYAVDAGAEDNLVYGTPDGTPAWFTANLRASYDFCKYASVQVGVDNIFNTQYRTFSSGINAPGRNIFAAIRLHY